MRIFTLSFGLGLFLSFLAPSSQAQGTQCDKECLQTVRSLLKGSYSGVSTSWLEKSNYRLGDKVGVAILRIYKGRELFKPDNIRTFLPVIENAFRDPEMIENAVDKQPTVTLHLLRRLKRGVKDHFLNREVTKTLNAIQFETTKGGP